MMKYLGILVILLGSSYATRAQEIPDIQDILSSLDNTHLVSTDVPSKADGSQSLIATQIDVVLEQLLHLPFEQRQYIFPSLFTMPDLPKKIRTHPEIAVWEGKLPTRIAPEAQQFADRYLHILNPQLFPYLSPEAYGTDTRDKPDSVRSTDWGTAIRHAHHIVPLSSVQAYPKLKDIIHQPADLIQSPNQHLLSVEDVHRLSDGFRIFNAFLNDKNKYNSDFQTKEYSSTLFNSEIEQNKVNPFQTKLNKLRLSEEEESALDAQMQQAGWKDARTFSATADAMARAYRASRLSLPIAFSIRRQRGKNAVTQLDQMVTTLAKMHEALPADVYLAIRYRDEIRKAFIEAGYQSVLNAETVDAGRK